METFNEKKAREIAKKWQTPCHGAGDCEYEAYHSALEAMELKDKEWSERFKKAFEGLWSASFNVEDFSSKIETTIEFKLVTRE